MKEIFQTSNYTIFFDKKGYLKLKESIKNNTKISSVFILTDKNTLKLCFPYLRSIVQKLQNSKIFCLSPGEKEKNIQNCINIWSKLTKNCADRQSLLINLGGGVITDLGGFVASVFKRGIDFINIPTTLLSMVDAAIGGKTGIDLDGIKNEIGIFNYAKFLIIDDFYLKTLNKREFKSGIAEIFKYGLIYDKNLWETMKNILKCNKISWKNIIYRSCIIKNSLVSKDPYEKIGIRKILNFGHTIGHGIESYFIRTDFPILHGEAIVLGMICESWISLMFNGLSKKQYEDIIKTFIKNFSEKLEKIIRYITPQAIRHIIEYIFHDKKNSKKNIYMSLIKEIGKCTYNQIIEVNFIKDSLSSLRGISNFKANDKKKKMK